MTYRLRKGESVSAGLKRVVTSQSKAAIKQLADAEPSSEATHEARKSIKKVRAVLQLLRHDVGHRRDWKRLRRASRLLSPLRDADAMIASVESLRESGRPKLSDETRAAVTDVLERHKERLCRAAKRDRATDRAANALQQLRRSARGWVWKSVGFRVLAAAVRRSYKKAKREMDTARKRRQGEDFHNWRKRVKTLWYALRLLQELAPRRRLLADLEQLETWLGEDHNLLTLRTLVLGNRGLSRTMRGEMKALSERRQTRLRRQALATGARVLNATPEAFIQQLREPWRNRQRGLRRPRSRAQARGRS